MIIATICAIGAAILVVNLIQKTRDQGKYRLAPIPVESQRHANKAQQKHLQRFRN